MNISYYQANIKYREEIDYTALKKQKQKENSSRCGHIFLSTWAHKNRHVLDIQMRVAENGGQFRGSVGGGGMRKQAKRATYAAKWKTR